MYWVVSHRVPHERAGAALLPEGEVGREGPWLRPAKLLGSQ